MTSDGVQDLLLGRDDGLVQVYSFSDMEEPTLRFSHVSLFCVLSVLMFHSSFHISLCVVARLPPLINGNYNFGKTLATLLA